MFKKRKISKSSLSQKLSVRSEDPQPQTPSNPTQKSPDPDLPPPLDQDKDPKQPVDTPDEQPPPKDEEPVVKRRRVNDSLPLSSKPIPTSSKPSSLAATTPAPPVVARFGPSRKLASQNAGTAGNGGVQTDYAPDVCKDYKQTGFCGYGDTCKFLHMREDYAAGWQIDRAWAAQQRERAAGEKARDQEKDKEDEETKQSNVATVCPLCLGPLAAPVITKECGHVFCEKCFLGEFKKRHECKVCGESLSGIVSPYRPVKS